MLIEEIIDVNLCDNPSNPKIIQLGKYLSEEEKDVETTSETKGTKQEQEGSTEEDPSLCSEE